MSRVSPEEVKYRESLVKGICDALSPLLSFDEVEKIRLLDNANDTVALPPSAVKCLYMEDFLLPSATVNAGNKEPGWFHTGTLIDLGSTRRVIEYFLRKGDDSRFERFEEMFLAARRIGQRNNLDFETWDLGRKLCSFFEKRSIYTFPRLCNEKAYISLEEPAPESYEPPVDKDQEDVLISVPDNGAKPRPGRKALVMGQIYHKPTKEVGTLDLDEEGRPLILDNCYKAIFKDEFPDLTRIIPVRLTKGPDRRYILGTKKVSV